MHRLLHIMLALSILLLPLRATAQNDGDYLTDQAVFDAAWAKLSASLGEAPDLVNLRVMPDRIEVMARAPEGGARIDFWAIDREGPLLMKDLVIGPQPQQAPGFPGGVEGAFFSLDPVPLDRLVSISAQLLDLAPFEDPARVVEVTIARKTVLLPNPTTGEVGWRITAATPRETALVEATADGTLFGLDLSNTMRGRNRNFLTQDDWPLAEAQAGFEELAGADADIFGVRVLAGSITITTRRPEYPDSRTSISWDGWRYTRGLVDLPANPLSEGETFVLADLPLKNLPEVLRTAWAQVENQ